MGHYILNILFTVLLVNCCFGRRIGTRNLCRKGVEGCTNNFPTIDHNSILENSLINFQQNITLRPRILGGRNAKLGESPWLVNLEYRTPKNKLSLLCAGSVINHRYILTAAHCIRGEIEKFGQLISIRAGEYDLQSEIDCDEKICLDPFQRFNIAEYKIHPEFYTDKDKRNYNDLALIKVDRDIMYSNSIPAVAMPTIKFPHLSPGTLLTVSGWGAGYWKGDWSALIPVKQVVHVPYVTNEKCVLANSVHHLCAGEYMKDSCYGDSGGPLIRSLHNTQYVVGIVSYGTTCGSEKPAVYTRVSSFIEWIRENSEI
uniref:Peptidase S1 domain-containing protein n=1 Tax=Musca domestica TaxID=7370 RepID=A0A1I8NL98_MUSDO